MEAHGESWFWNGTAFAPCAGIPLADRGFRYGMAFFESLAIRGGEAEFLDAHLSRLQAACAQCGWPVEPATLAGAGEWLRQASFPAPTFARLYVTAGEGGPTAPVSVPRLFLFCEPRSPALPAPYRLAFSPSAHLPLLGGLKTANYWANVEALRAAKAAGCDEALLFNPKDELISACMANVFVVLEGELVTPAPATGARRGVVREWVMRRRPVAERTLHRRDLENATECFLTSSWLGVTPVASLNARPRPLWTSIADALRAEFLTHRG